MRIAAFEFKPSRWPTLGAVLLVSLTVWLGLWQTSRGDEKERRQRLLESRSREAPVVLTGSVAAAEPLLFRRIRASGEFQPGGQVYVDNQVHQGRAGYLVYTPLKLRDGALLLVNRGWIARGADYPRPPPAPVPAGAVEASGIATLPPARFLELGSQPLSGNVWQNLTIERYRAVAQAPVLPVVLLADAPGAGLATVSEAPDAGVAKHREYALTWFSLAATAAALWIVMNLKRVR